MPRELGHLRRIGPSFCGTIFVELQPGHLFLDIFQDTDNFCRTSFEVVVVFPISAFCDFDGDGLASSFGDRLSLVLVIAGAWGVLG